jgi:hypothetical protein
VFLLSLDPPDLCTLLLRDAIAANRDALRRCDNVVYRVETTPPGVAARPPTRRSVSPLEQTLDFSTWYL